MSRYQHPDPLPPPPEKPVEREVLKEPPIAPPAAPKVEAPAERETLAPPPAPPPLDTLPEEIVMRLIESGRTAFVRCFKRAAAADPLTFSFKVRVHVELDAEGKLTSGRTDSPDAQLSSCLVRTTGWLQFPASGKPVAVEFPLIYRVE